METVTMQMMVEKTRALMPKYGGNVQFAANQAWLLAGGPADVTVEQIEAAAREEA